MVTTTAVVTTDCLLAVCSQALLEVERKKVAEAGLASKAEMHLLQKEIAMLQQAVTDKDDLYFDLKVR